MKKHVVLLLWFIIAKSFLYGQTAFYVRIPQEEDIPDVSNVQNSNLNYS